MNVTAIFVSAEDCSSCQLFKRMLLSQVTNAFQRKGVKCRAPYICASMNEGFERNPPLRFLTRVRYFPALILVRTDLLEAYENGTLSESNLLPRLFLYNGMVDSGLLVVADRKYGSKVADFERFLEDFTGTGLYLSPPPTVTTVKKQVVKQQPHSNSEVMKSKMNARGGIRTVSIKEK